MILDTSNHFNSDKEHNCVSAKIITYFISYVFIIPLNQDCSKVDFSAELRSVVIDLLICVEYGEQTSDSWLHSVSFSCLKYRSSIEQYHLQFRTEMPLIEW